MIRKNHKNSIHLHGIFFREYSRRLDILFRYLICLHFFQHEKEYREIIEAAKGTEKEKEYASLFIGKFFEHFPNLADEAINALLDLCEDENIEYRRRAFYALPLLCKDTKVHIPKIVDMLARFLIVDDQSHLEQVHASLQKFLKFDTKAALAAVVSHKVLLQFVFCSSGKFNSFLNRNFFHIH